MYRFARGFAGFGSFGPPPANIQTVLQGAASSSGVPLSILDALAYQESSYNPSAVSPKGAQGLLQLMPATGASLGVKDPFDAQQNANAGASYLRSLYDKYGDWQTALIAYNEGPGNLATQGPFSSSQTYASTILANAGVDASAAGPFVGPPDVFGGSAPASSTAPAGGVPASWVGTSDSAPGDFSALPASSGPDPLILAGLAAGALGLIFLAA